MTKSCVKNVRKKLYFVTCYVLISKKTIVFTLHKQKKMCLKQILIKKKKGTDPRH